MVVGEMLMLVFQKCKIGVCGLLVYKFDDCPKMAKKIDTNFKKKKANFVDSDGVIDKPGVKNSDLKKPVFGIVLQPNRRTRSLGLETGFNPGNGHSNLGQIYSHEGSLLRLRKGI